MKITDIAYKSNGEAEIFIDGEAAAAVDPSLLSSLGLRRGSELDSELYAELARAGAYHAARESAFRSLERAAFSKKGLEKRLRQKGCDAESAAAVAQEFEQKGYIDDAAYAESCLLHFSEGKRYGKYRVALEMRNRGLGKTVIDRTLESAEPDENNIRFYIEKNRMSGDRRKDAAKLMRAGYRYETINRVLAQSEEENGEY